MVLVGALTAGVAGAHSADADRATNYRTTIVDAPAQPGVTVAAVDAGRSIELRNAGDTDVVVLGYAGEPYLRIGPRGVHQNRRSPATYLNASLTSDTPLPADADPHAEPEWVAVSTEPVARWHDHRAHWMGLVDPPAVRDEPQRRHLLIDDEIPLEIDGQPARIGIQVTWEPPPSPWLWIASGALVIAALAVLGASRHDRAAARAAGVLLVTLIVAQAVVATTTFVPPPLWWMAALVVALVATITGLVLLGARPRVAVTLLGGAGVLVAALVGVPDHAWLLHTQLPTELDPFAARLLVTATVAVGTGLGVLALVRTARPDISTGDAPLATPTPTPTTRFPSAGAQST
jgi:hypothetical protein